LLEGVVDRGLVVWAWLLQYVIKHTGASRGRLGALAGRVDREGLVLVAPLRARRGGASCLSCPACSSVGAPWTCCPPQVRRPRACPSCCRRWPPPPPSRSKASGNIEQLVGVDPRAPPELAHEVPTGRALEEGVHDLGLSNARDLGTTLGEAPYEVPIRFTELLGARP
jgi:hypothetical protein